MRNIEYNEPCRNTCPKINAQISTLEDIQKHIDDYSELPYGDNDDLLRLVEGYREDAHSWKLELNGVIDGFEDLRQDNLSLRDWGNRMVEAATDRDNEVDRLNDIISNLEDQISDKDKVISELEADLDYAREHALNEYC